MDQSPPLCQMQTASAFRANSKVRGLGCGWVLARAGISAALETWVVPGPSPICDQNDRISYLLRSIAVCREVGLKSCKQCLDTCTKYCSYSD